MRFLLDTNVIIDICKGHARVSSRFQAASAADQLTVNPVVVGELLGGLLRLPDGERSRLLDAAVRRVLSALTVVPISNTVAEPYAKLKHQQELRGLRLADNDLWIAATAISEGMTLVTRDTDFSRIEGLSLQNWSS